MAKKERSKERPSRIEVNIPPEFGYTKWESWGKSWEKNWQQRQRTGMLWFGLFLLAAGGLWYGVVKGYIQAGSICPGLLIIIGAIMVFRALLGYLHR